jgi:hypothetical protein
VGCTTGIRFSAEAKDISVLHRVETDSGAHLFSYPISTGALSPEVKRPGREADHAPPSSADVKNGGAIPALPNIFSWRDA